MTEAQKVKKLVIAGGGTAGWMAAAAMSKTFGDTLDITLVESEQIGTIGVGEATIPPMQRFNDIVGITEIDFMRNTKGTFKLGINFENWTKNDHAYFHSFGTTGRDHWSCTFNHFWQSGQARGHNNPYGDYCLELVAAEQNKFAHLPDKSLNYAFHLDSAQYARYLRKLSEEHGATRLEGKIDEVKLDAESGNIAALLLDNGMLVEGDLFIDCTGFRALLIGDALGTPYDDWSHYLPCDSAIAIQTKSVGPPIPYTRSIAHQAGWQWRIPLQHRTGNGIVYCSKYMSQDEALDKITSTLDGEQLTQPNFIKFTTGARQKQWVKNCIAVGLSSGFMEPLESTSIHLIQRNILRLVQLMPNNNISQRDIDQFNKQAEFDMSSIRDFLILHYIANERDEPFWDYCRNMDVPETLTHKIELFRETGRVFRENEELFAENSWIQVMMGQGIEPRAYHPIADKMSDKEIDMFLGEIRNKVSKTVATLPTHEQYISTDCAASDTPQ